MGNTSDYFPEEILHDILLKLPLKSLCRYLGVCKSWHSLIKSEAFITSHLNQTLNTQRNTHLLLRVNTGNKKGFLDENGDEFRLYPYDQATRRVIDVPSLVIRPPPRPNIYFTCYTTICVCNGLLCLMGFFNKSTPSRIILWNPSIRKFVTLPESSIDLSQPYAQTCYVVGFGVNLSDNDYKVVRIVMLIGTSNTIISTSAEVCSLRTRTWRKINNVCANVPKFSQAYLNGRSHWIGQRNETLALSLIISFDMADEIFREVSLPEKVTPKDKVVYSRLTTISREGRECLAIIWTAQGREGSHSFNIWVMNEYGVSESWNNMYKIVGTGLTIDNFWFAGLDRNAGNLIKALGINLICFGLKDGHGPRVFKLADDRQLSVLHAQEYVESLVLL